MRSSCVLILCCLALQSAFAAETNLTLTVDGITYSNVTFGTTTPATVGVFHSSGIASLPLAKLPSDLQKQFGYDAEKAKEYQQRLVKEATAQKVSEAKRKELEKKKLTAIHWQGNVQNVYSYGMVVAATRGADFNSMQQFLLVGHPNQKNLGSTSAISFRAYQEGTRDVPDWNSTFEKWVWVEDVSPETERTPPRRRTDPYSRQGLFP